MRWRIGIPIIFSLMITGCLSNDDYEKLNESNYEVEIEYHSASIGVGSIDYLNNGIDQFKGINLTDTEFEKLKDDDENYLIVQSWETQQVDGQPFLLVNFTIPNGVNEIIIKWKGYGSQPFMGDVDNIVLIYVFNNKDNNWNQKMKVEWDDEINLKEKEIIFRISDLSTYVSDSNVIKVIIFGPYGAGNSTGTLMNEVMCAKGKE